MGFIQSVKKFNKVRSSNGKNFFLLILFLPCFILLNVVAVFPIEQLYSDDNIFSPSWADPTNFFCTNRFSLSLQTVYSQPVFALDSLVQPTAAFSILADYALIPTDYFIFSPVVEISFLKHDGQDSQTDIDQLSSLGVAGGVNLTLTFPGFRLLSLHVRGTAGWSLSFIDSTKYTIIGVPLFSSAFEVRFTFLERFSVSAIIGYMAICYSDSVLQETQCGMGLGYRF